MNINMDKFMKAVLRFLDHYGIDVIDCFPDEEIIVGHDEGGYAIIAYGVVDDFSEARRFTITTEKFEDILDRVEFEVNEIEKIRYDILLFMPRNVNEGILRYEKDAGDMIKKVR